MKVAKLLATVITMSMIGVGLFAQPAKTEPRLLVFGACYTLYSCQGGSIGSFTDLQCREMGGHSIMSAGVCINL